MIKKKDLLAEKQDLFEKKLQGKVHSQKKRFCDTKKQDLSEKKRGMIKTEKRRISSHPRLTLSLVALNLSRKSFLVTAHHC